MSSSVSSWGGKLDSSKQQKSSLGIPITLFFATQELKEMQRLLVQSACEAFAAADISKSRSNSGASSVNQSSTGTSSLRSKSVVHSPKAERLSTLRRGHFQHKRSSSLCSISGGRGSPGVVRGKTFIRRSESIQLSRTLSPLLGEITLFLFFVLLIINPSILKPFHLQQSEIFISVTVNPFTL